MPTRAHFGVLGKSFFALENSRFDSAQTSASARAS